MKPQSEPVVGTVTSGASLFGIVRVVFEYEIHLD